MAVFSTATSRPEFAWWMLAVKKVPVDVVQM